MVEVLVCTWCVLSVAAVAGGAGAGSPCGNAWIVYHGMGGKSGVRNGGSCYARDGRRV